jgi:TolA-binding protein
MVAVGLWYVPQLRQRPEAVGSTVTHSSFVKSEPSSDRLKPAEPLDLAIDKRSGRIHPKGVEPLTVNTLRRDSSAPAEKLLAAEAEKAVAADVSAERSRPRTGVPALENAQGKGLVALPMAPSEAKAIAPASSDTAPQKSAETESVSAIYDRAISRFRNGNYEEAIKDLSHIADQSEASTFQRKAILYLGRSYRDSGRCELAIPPYRKLIARYPITPEGGDAMVEAANCYRRMGEPEQADKLIERASQHPWLTPRARRELNRLGY